MRRGRRKRDIVIELTSLLDVIMIIIFMVMKENSRVIGEKQNALNAAQQVNAQQAGEIGELSGRLEDLELQLAEAEEKLEGGTADELREKLSAAENKLESYKAIDDVVIVLNIGLENNYNNSIRTLTYGKVSEDSTVLQNRSNEEFDVSLNKLRVFVTDYITKVLDDKDNQTIVYVVFTYDSRKVFERDYEAVGEALKDAERKANSGNFRYRINPIT